MCIPQSNGSVSSGDIQYAALAILGIIIGVTDHHNCIHRSGGGIQGTCNIHRSVYQHLSGAIGRRGYGNRAVDIHLGSEFCSETADRGQIAIEYQVHIGILFGIERAGTECSFDNELSRGIHIEIVGIIAVDSEAPGISERCIVGIYIHAVGKHHSSAVGICSFGDNDFSGFRSAAGDCVGHAAESVVTVDISVAAVFAVIRINIQSIVILISDIEVVIYRHIIIVPYTGQQFVVIHCSGDISGIIEDLVSSGGKSSGIDGHRTEGSKAAELHGRGIIHSN